LLLGSIRDDKELAKLPADEQVQCKKLWADVGALVELSLLWKAEADVAESRQFFEDAGASGETWGALQAAQQGTSAA